MSHARSSCHNLIHRVTYLFTRHMYTCTDFFKFCNIPFMSHNFHHITLDLSQSRHVLIQRGWRPVALSRPSRLLSSSSRPPTETVYFRSVLPSVSGLLLHHHHPSGASSPTWLVVLQKTKKKNIGKEFIVYVMVINSSHDRTNAIDIFLQIGNLQNKEPFAVICMRASVGALFWNGHWGHILIRRQMMLY